MTVALQQSQLLSGDGHGSEDQQRHQARHRLQPPAGQEVVRQPRIVRQAPDHAKTDQQRQTHQLGRGQNRTRQLHSANVCAD